MDRRDFFKFLRDGGAALVAAITVGIPKIEDKKPAFVSEEIELTPLKSIEEEISKLLQKEFPGIPVYTTQYESYGRDAFSKAREHPEELYKFDHGKEIIDNGWPYKLTDDTLTWTEIDNEFGNDIIYMEKIDYARWHPKQPNKLFTWDAKELQWYRVFTGIDYLFET